MSDNDPRLNPWNALSSETKRFRPVAARANFKAPSIASVPELQKKTASRCAGVRFVRASARRPLSKRAIHLHHVGQIELEDIADRLLHDRMIAADVVNAVSTQKVQILGIIHIVEICPLRPGIDLVETDDTLRRHQRAVEMSLVQVVILTQPGGDDLL